MSDELAKLLDRNIPTDYRSEWSAQVASVSKGEGDVRHSAFVFRIGTEWCAFPPDLIRAVVGPRPVHAVPHHRDGVLMGLVTLRGHIHLCISLHRMLNLQHEAPKAVLQEGEDDKVRLVIFGGDRDAIVFPADEVHGIVRYTSDSLREVPPAYVSGIRYTTQLMIWNDRTVALLDGGLLLYSVERALV